MRARTDRLHQLHATVCKALSDPKRLLILDALRDGELAVSELEERLGAPQANVSQHLRVLRQKRLVTTRRDGPWIYYSLASPKIVEALDLLADVMDEVGTTEG